MTSLYPTDTWVCHGPPLIGANLGCLSAMSIRDAGKVSSIDKMLKDHRSKVVGALPLGTSVPIRGVSPGGELAPPPNNRHA